MAKLYFRYATMNAGKSLALLQVAHNYETAGGARRSLLVTASLDDRFKKGFIHSRLGPNKEALTFDSTTSFLQDVLPYALQEPRAACVLVDEAQFLSPAQVRELHRFAHEHDMPVICYGLRTNFLGEPFKGAAWLLALADDMEELKTVCACGKKAVMNMRVDPSGKKVTTGSIVEIGGEARYRAVCATCYYAA